MTPEDAAALLERGPAHVLLHVLEHILTLERKLMTAIDDVATKVAALTDAVTASNGKVDALIALCNSNFAALQAFISQGGLSQAQEQQLIAIQNSIQATMDSLTSEDAKVDAAVAADSPAPPPPPPAPPAGDQVAAEAPAPAPAETPEAPPAAA